jgi:single-stranded-DNA-specific exonuclease
MREHGITKDMLIPTMSIDGHIAQDRITMELASALASLEPFGEGNAEPRFLLSGITMAAPRAIGNEGAHLQGTVRGQRTIGFHLGHLAGILKDQPIDAVVRIMINRWKNRNDLQIVVDDVRLSEE